MKGCRPLNREERRRAISSIKDSREAALLALGFSTGFRISELLSIKISDVIGHGGRSQEWVKVAHTKNGEGRTVKLNSQAGKVACELAKNLIKKGFDRNAPLFVGAKSKVKAISRVHAWRLLKDLYARAEIMGAVATHTLRKTFAADMYRLLNGAIEKVAVALGHKTITSTVSYLSFKHSEIDDAMLALEII